MTRSVSPPLREFWLGAWWDDADVSSIKGQSEFISLSALGMVGMTAYMGAFPEMDLKKEHVVVVSGAAGWVSSHAVGREDANEQCRRLHLDSDREECCRMQEGRRYRWWTGQVQVVSRIRFRRREVAKT